jgi:prepilin signal peptidase PulO-like enzyme (type II secretory pathway)
MLTSLQIFLILLFLLYIVIAVFQFIFFYLNKKSTICNSNIIYRMIHCIAYIMSFSMNEASMKSENKHLATLKNFIKWQEKNQLKFFYEII